jgi:SAM-dependent methyltransferase
MEFHDHFSGHAADYAAHRPRYPRPLFDYLAFLSPRRRRAWDCGTGNGQAALALAERFQEVIATDPSATQIAEAAPHERVRYLVAPAEDTPLEDASVDLVTVAQALHWFDFDKFYEEVRRVARPDGVLAVWAYGLHRVGPGVDEVLKRYYSEIVGPFWPPERRHVEEEYRTIPFPFRGLPSPSFEMRHGWNLRNMLDYLGTWSATKRYEQANGHDPRSLIAVDLSTAWGGPEVVREVRWPLHLRMGSVHERGAGL